VVRDGLVGCYDGLSSNRGGWDSAQACMSSTKPVSSVSSYVIFGRVTIVLLPS
jgi:hypothetical protein